MRYLVKIIEKVAQQLAGAGEREPWGVTVEWEKSFSFTRLKELWRWMAMMVTHVKYLIPLSCTLEMVKPVEIYVLYILTTIKIQKMLQVSEEETNEYMFRTLQ